MINCVIGAIVFALLLAGGVACGPTSAEDSPSDNLEALKKAVEDELREHQEPVRIGEIDVRIVEWGEMGDARGVLARYNPVKRHRNIVDIPWKMFDVYKVIFQYEREVPIAGARVEAYAYADTTYLGQRESRAISYSEMNRQTWNLWQQSGGMKQMNTTRDLTHRLFDSYWQGLR